MFKNKKILLFFGFVLFALPSWAEQTASEKAVMFFELSEEAIKAGDDKLGLEYLQSAASLVPERSAILHEKIAEIYIRRQNWNKALEHYQFALKQSPRNALYFSALGMIHTQLNEFEQAQGYFDKAYKLDPNNEEVLLKRGVFFVAKKKLEEAEQVFSDILLLNPGNIAAKTNLANVLVKNKNYDMALKQYRELIRFGEKDSFIMMGMAEAYLGIGNTKRAKAILTELKQYLLSIDENLLAQDLEEQIKEIEKSEVGSK